ncbi:MAG: metallophosphoesterase [Magnetococcales bacterium]|nr:metallophosphoesterase [Magnetococcales bacterium]
MMRLLGFIAIFGLFFWGSGWGLEPGFLMAQENPPSLSCKNNQANSLLQVIALGDSRRPNTDAKYRILEAVLEEEPDLFIHLGDMVPASTADFWQRFDREEGRILQAGIPFLPVVGNHEYFTESWLNETPLEPFFERFPELNGSSWYRYTCGPLELLALDGELGLEEGGAQHRWLEKILQTPKEGRFRLVGVHYPPVSGMGFKSWPWKKTLFAFFANLAAGEDQQVDMVLSGHIHNYERFERLGIHYVVSGGGGSPPNVIHNRLADDLYYGPEANYHYMRFTITPRHILGEMVRFDPETKEFEVTDAFRVTD